MKDLSKLGRDLSKVIIVDNVFDNFKLQPDNGIFVQSWFNDANDTILSELLPLLKEIVERNAPDVRIALKEFRDQLVQKISKVIL